MRFTAILISVLASACGDGGGASPDAAPDSAARTCDESITTTTANRPPCTWAWTCSDFSGTLPQLAADCVAGTGTTVTCQCRESGRGATGTFTLVDGCASVADACAAANGACGFSVPIACPP